MSEVENQAVQFDSVASFVTHLEGLGDAAVSANEVAETLKAISAAAANSNKRRGQLSGIPLEEMTLEQLKRERINAGSVHYKAVKRGAPQETIDANKARLDAVIARIDALKPAEQAAESTDTAQDSTDVTTDAVEEVAAEI